MTRQYDDYLDSLTDEEYEELMAEQNYCDELDALSECQQESHRMELDHSFEWTIHEHPAEFCDVLCAAPF